MKKFSTGLLTGLLIGLLLAGSTIVFASTPIKLLINGQYINCDVEPQIINGRTMVPAAYVATALGATVSWDEINQTVVINGKGYVPSVNNISPSGYGDIKGTITYQYNQFIGSRGDVGAEVILINKNTTPGSINFDPHYGMTGKFTTNSSTDLYRLTVNGTGHYEVNSIPAGEYVIVIKSKGANAYTGFVDPGFDNLIKPLFDSSYNLFRYDYTVMWKHLVDTITITPNVTLDYSYDFGYSM